MGPLADGRKGLRRSLEIRFTGPSGDFGTMIAIPPVH
jgi:hypothetical protein